MSSLQPALTVIVPCFNERSRLPPTLDSIRRYVRRQYPSHEIIIVDDGSRDGTADWVREQMRQDAALHLISYQPNRGKGYAVRQGMLAGRGNFLLFMDADGATRIDELDGMMPLLQNDQADIVIGSRTARGSHIAAAQSFLRRMGGKLFVVLAKVLVVRGIWDTQCGFKIFRREMGQTIFRASRTDSEIFDVEAIYLASKIGCRVIEYPVTWNHHPETRIPFNLKKSWNVIAELFRMRARHGIGWPPRVPTVPLRNEATRKRKIV